MRLATKGGISFFEKQTFRIFRVRKRVYQFFRYRPGMDKKVLFVVGCQRSGTTMVHHLLRLDYDTVTYDEFSPLSSIDPKGLRLDPLSVVHDRIRADRAPLVVSKPLVESQNLNALLDEFPEAKALWIFRHYQDVARSNVKFFHEGNSQDDLKPIVAFDQTNWRAEHMDPADIETIRGLCSPDMDPYDAAALFWYARNSLYFSRNYSGNDRIRLCQYGDLVTEPSRVMKEIYEFIGRPYPGDRIVADVFSGSKGKGKSLAISDPVRKVCDDLLQRLEAESRFGSTTPAG